MSRREERFEFWTALRRALRTVLADRRWPLKLIIGGALATTLLGAPFTQGYLMESMDNSRRGYPVPLPLWSDWGTKYIMGVMAVVIDFTYFVLPILLAAVLLFCTATFELLANTGATFITWVPPLLSLAILLAAFLLSLSPIAKLVLAEDGDLEKALGRLVVRTATRPPGRATYARARLASLPAYLPTLGAGLLFWHVISTTGSLMLTLLSGWLLSSAIFFAHLVAAQIYLAAADVVRKAEFAARLAEREHALRGGR